MAKDLNQIILTGRLSQDPEIKSTTTGKTVARLSLAVSKPGGDGADFFNMTAWEKTAELVQNYLSKGSRILVLGALSIDSWEKDGQKFARPNITIRDVTFLDSKSQNSGNKQESKVELEKSADPIDLSDIPF